jgi:hypothetical protein
MQGGATAVAVNGKTALVEFNWFNPSNSTSYKKTNVQTSSEGKASMVSQPGYGQPLAAKITRLSAPGTLYRAKIGYEYSYK